jgi:hypothetical protein
MSKAMQQCPFLDGGDKRCSNRFRLEHLKHAFKFCFGRYRACPTYLQLQVEGRLRRIEGSRIEIMTVGDAKRVGSAVRCGCAQRCCDAEVDLESAAVSDPEPGERAEADAVVGASCG